jgi:PPOX class probable F420-dependent enzyme
MIDPTTPKGSRAVARLTDEPVIWLTTVSPGGQPQTSPVWFLYDGEFLIYSLGEAARLRNIDTNPRVSLNLDGNGEGGDIISIEGRARVDRTPSPSTDVPAYQAKYTPYIERNGWTPEQFATDYPVAIRITPTRVRVW